MDTNPEYNTSDKNPFGSLFMSNDIYRRMIEEIQDYAILFLDIRGRIMNLNTGVKTIKGYTQKEIIGKHFSIFYQESDQKNNLPQKLLSEAKKNGRVVHEGWRVSKDQNLFWAGIVITAIHNHQGEVIGYTKITHDLTDRKIAEEQLKAYTIEIEEKNRQLEQYAYIASHDLQEPLRKLQLYSGLLEQADDKETISRYTEKIKGASVRMSRLIQEILNYAQFSNSKEELKLINLNEIFETVISDYSSIIEEKSVTIICGELPLVAGISVQLYQLFSNLISNAIKFSGESPSIIISWDKLSKEDRKELVEHYGHSCFYRISFTDNGIGFDPLYASQIFEMFKRLTSNPGTGIGLALCKRVMENHNGHIATTSTPGMGATFYIFFPSQNNATEKQPL